MGSGEGARKSRDALLKKIAIIEKLTLNSHPASPKRQAKWAPIAKVSSLIAIGASTGGPKALADILSCMPANLAAGIIIAQHVDGEFSAGMARWLDEQSPLSIRLAEEGACPSRGTALLAGKNDHLVLTPTLTWFTPGSPRLRLFVLRWMNCSKVSRPTGPRWVLPYC